MNNQELVLGIFFTILTVTLVLSLLLSVVLYVFQSIGLFAISRRRQLGTSAFAWIPILNDFKFGQIADDAIYRKSGKNTHFRAFLPIIAIASVVIVCVGMFLSSVSIALPEGLISSIMQGNFEAIQSISTATIASPASLTIGIILVLIGGVLAIISSVLAYIIAYHVYKSCSTKYIVMFILSFVFPVLIAFFLFAIRRNNNPVYYKSADSAPSAQEVPYE